MALVLADILYLAGNRVRLWGPLEQKSGFLANNRKDESRLANFYLDKKIKVITDAEEALFGADIIVNAIPTSYLSTLWLDLGPFVPENAILVSSTKGLESKTMRRPSEIIGESIGKTVRDIVAISGPCIAKELAKKIPSAAVVSGNNLEICKLIQRAFSTSWFRTYINQDIIGTEFAGALKNIIAIASGVLDSLGYGINTKGLLHSRGLAEMLRFSEYFGGKRDTFLGLAGCGDLVTTCHSKDSRNRSFGELLGKGFSFDQALKQVGSVVEGVPTAKAVYRFAKEKNIKIPITESVFHLINGDSIVDKAIKELMDRSLREEF